MHTKSMPGLLFAVVVVVVVFFMVSACSNLGDKTCNVEVIPACVKLGDTVLNPGTSVDLKLELISGEQIPQHIFYVQKPDASFDTVSSESRYYTIGPAGVYKLIVSFPACEGKELSYLLKSTDSILAPVVHLFSVPADSVELGKGALMIRAQADFKTMDSNLFVWQKGAVVLGSGRTSISFTPKRPGMDTVSLFYNDFVFKFGFKVTAKVVNQDKLQKVLLDGFTGIQALIAAGKRKEASDRKNTLMKESGGGQLLILYPNGCPEDTCRSIDEFYQILKMGTDPVKSVAVKPVPNAKSVFTVKIN